LAARLRIAWEFAHKNRSQLIFRVAA
jgi:hypothetical protein